MKVWGNPNFDNDTDPVWETAAEPIQNTMVSNIILLMVAKDLNY